MSETQTPETLEPSLPNPETMTPQQRTEYVNSLRARVKQGGDIPSDAELRHGIVCLSFIRPTTKATAKKKTAVKASELSEF